MLLFFLTKNTDEWMNDMKTKLKTNENKTKFKNWKKKTKLN